MNEWQTASLSALIGAVSGLIANYIGAAISRSSERKQFAWEMEVNRIVQLEERTGETVEIATSHAAVEDILPEITSALQRMKRDAGSFRRHGHIKQALRDLCNGIWRLLDGRQAHSSETEKVRAEVEQLYKALLDACDEVTGKRTV